MGFHAVPHSAAAPWLPQARAGCRATAPHTRPVCPSHTTDEALSPASSQTAPGQTHGVLHQSPETLKHAVRGRGTACGELACTPVCLLKHAWRSAGHVMCAAGEQQQVGRRRAHLVAVPPHLPPMHAIHSIPPPTHRTTLLPLHNSGLAVPASLMTAGTWGWLRRSSPSRVGGGQGWGGKMRGIAW